MKNKPRKNLRGRTLQEFEMVPITDAEEIAALDRRIREAELRLANAPEINGCQSITGGVSYAQLDNVLRSLGFTCREVTLHDDARVYEHPQTGATFAVPAVPMTDGVPDCRLLTMRSSLDLYGIIEPTEFDAKLKRAG